jgi:hypothetical protein
MTTSARGVAARLPSTLVNSFVPWYSFSTGMNRLSRRTDRIS